VRRIISATLLLLFSLPLIAPYFASSSESSLPACCRRNGAHHCAGIGIIAQFDQKIPSIGATCPIYPKAMAVIELHSIFLQGSQSRFAEIVAHPSGQPQTEARYRVAFSRSRQKRGPPIILV
jgi:hypothetical protein